MLDPEIELYPIKMIMKRSHSHLHIHNIYHVAAWWAPKTCLLAAGLSFLARLNPFSFCLTDDKWNQSPLQDHRGRGAKIKFRQTGKYQRPIPPSSFSQVFFFDQQVNNE